MVDEFKIKADSFKDGYDRISQATEQQTQELTQLRIQLSDMQQKYQKLNCDQQLVSQQLIKLLSQNQKDTKETELPKLVQGVQLLIQEQNRNYSKLQEELDGIAIQCNGLQD